MGGGKSRKGGLPSLKLIQRIMKGGKSTVKKKTKIDGKSMSLGLGEKSAISKDS